MKKRLLSLLLCGIPVWAVADEPFQVRSTVQGCVNVREAPNTGTAIQACLAANEPVVVFNSEPFWREIRFDSDSRTGWIAKKFIVPSNPVATDSVPVPIPGDRWLTLHFIDVGQGDAIWISTADDDIDGNGIFEGRNVFIDGGPYSSNNDNPLLDYMEAQAHHLARLDALIVTHPHIDHYAGAELLTRHFEISDYYDPGFPGTSSYNAFLANFADPETVVDNVHRTPGVLPTLDWGSELQAEFLYSWPGVNTGLGHGSTLANNASMVLKLTYGAHSFLFMGDAEGKERNDASSISRFVEEVLRDQGAAVDVDVLKIAHHGSETSSTDAWVQAVNPDLLIVQSGRKCFSGTHLPDMSTLQRYCDRNANIQIYRTDHDDSGALTNRAAADGDHIVIRTNGAQLEVLQGQRTQCSALAAQVPQQSC